MRGRKSYNIRNIEAHLNTFRSVEQPILYPAPSRNIVFQTNVGNIGQPTVQSTIQPTIQQTIQSTIQQRLNERINAQYGVSKYAANQVSGKMFKKI
jgi:hypothetical protein